MKFNDATIGTRRRNIKHRLWMASGHNVPSHLIQDWGGYLAVLDAVRGLALKGLVS